MPLNRHAIRTAAAALLAAAMLPGSADAAATVTMRATGLQDLPKLTRLVARDTQPLLAANSGADALSGKTLGQVIRTLCGSVRPDYLPEFFAANETAIRAANRWPLADTQPLGTLAKSLVWPSCLYVVKNPSGVRKRADETARTLYVRLTGGDGTDKALKHFYKHYGKSLPQIERKLNRIPAGQTVVVPYATAAVTVTPKGGADDFKDAVKTAAVTARKPADANVRNPVTDNGRFVLDVSKDELRADPSHACMTAGHTPFDAEAVVLAYNHSLGEHGERAAQEVGVYVVDNGFFGAGRSVNPQFSDAFPKAFFQSAWDERGLVGPVVTYGGDSIWPENFLYLGGIARGSPPIQKIDETSGHGTHVAGLVLGGTYLFDKSRRKNFRSILFRGNRSWLDLSIVNIGMGQENPAPNIIPNVTSALGLRSGQFDIVNLSVEFLGRESNNFAAQFDDLFQNRKADLFVVAAGNDRKDVQKAAVFPAMRGGQDSANIVTVSATAGDGTLAFFTNTGKAEVDIAAPGCGITSWIDNKGTVRALNGTSQATPLVTFTAALLKSLDGGLQPVDIKSRLIASGDLIEPKAGVTLPWSLTRLDVSAALHLWDDYLRLDPTELPAPHAAGHTPREFLGKLVDVTGAVCAGEADPMNFNDIWSIKSGRLGQFLYGGRRYNTIVREPCQLDMRATHPQPQVVFQPTQEIVDGRLVPWTSGQLTTPVIKIQSLVRAVSQ